MPSKPRKPIANMIEELKSWLPNYDHGPADYPTLLWRILASMPGGDRAEDMGYEPFQLGWHEVDQLGRVLVAIQDKRDVEPHRGSARRRGGGGGRRGSPPQRPLPGVPSLDPRGEELFLAPGTRAYPGSH